MNALSIASTSIRQFDGLYSLNDLHTASGAEKKNQPSNFLRVEQTQDLVAEINRSSDVRNALKVKRGGEFQGTFACKEIVYAYAMWISPEFMLKVIRAYDSLVAPQPQLPSPNLAADVQRLHLSDLVKYEALKRGGGRHDYSSVWNEVKHVAGFSKLEHLTKTAYLAAVKYFEVEPMGTEPVVSPPPIPKNMQLIPNLRDDEYYWKGGVHAINQTVDHGKYKSRMIHYKPEQCVLIPFNTNIDRIFEVHVRNGLIRRYEKTLAQMAFEMEGWRVN